MVILTCCLFRSSPIPKFNSSFSGESLPAYSPPSRSTLLSSLAVDKDVEKTAESPSPSLDVFLIEKPSPTVEDTPLPVIHHSSDSLVVHFPSSPSSSPATPEFGFLSVSPDVPTSRFSDASLP